MREHHPIACSLFAAALWLAAPLAAQHQHEPPPRPPEEQAEPRPAQPPPAEKPAEPAPPAEHGEHAAAAEGGHAAGAGHAIPAFYGPYPMTRESSGTAWQPESAPHPGHHFRHGDWDLMLHGHAALIYDEQDGPRGDSDLFSANMLMLMGNRPAGRGRAGFRAMLSAEPWTIGDEGYPLLLQTGETADGRTPLVDRQHPHDLFMELAGTYTLPLDGDSSVFVYLALPGEPALGPPAFMHRFSGWENPEAPLAHHWLDSTHITYGVATLGWVRGGWKLEGSLFTGREPDERREDLEGPKMDSWSLRASWQPAPDWSFQVSHGRLESPEQLEPEVDTARTSASAIYNRRLAGGTWQTTFAWGRNAKDPGATTDALLLESALGRGRHTVFARAERLENDELFGHGHEDGNGHGEDHLEGRVFTVGKLTLGGLDDFWTRGALRAGAGALVSVALLPRELEETYGDTPLSWMVFARLRL